MRALLLALLAGAAPAAHPRGDGGVGEGAAAARQVLSDLVRLPAAERRAAADLVLRAGEADCVEPVAALLAAEREPDPAVRTRLAEFLARADLGRAQLERRVAALAGLVLEDAAAPVRAAALERLAALSQPEAGAELDRLVDQLSGPPRLAAARGLAGTAQGRAAAVRRVARMAEGAERPDGALLAVLLELYGGALLELAAGGESARDVAPLVTGLLHPEDAVRLGARAGLDALLRGLTEALDPARVERVLQALEQAGLSPREVDLRRASLALRWGEEPERAIPAARRLAPRAPEPRDRGALAGAFRARVLEAAALMATDRPREAGPLLDAAAAGAAELVRERLDLAPLPSEPSPRRRGEALDAALSLALVDVLRAALLVLDGTQSDAPELLAVLRSAHVRLLDAQVRAEAWDLPTACDLDALLGHPLGPRALLYDNPENARLPRSRGIELLTALGRGFAAVAPTEMPGFEPPSGLLPALADPLRDPQRFRLLRDIDTAYSQRLLVRSQAEDVSQAERRQLLRRYAFNEDRRRRAESEVGSGKDPAEAFRYLAEHRDPSDLALALARDLRQEGRPLEARARVSRLREDLRSTGQGGAWLLADVDLVLASTYTEEDLPLEAERILEGVLLDLESFAGQARDARSRAREAGDVQGEARAELQLSATEQRKADCLVSLAVNANVRQNDPEKALRWFEQAYELDQRDFMRVLLACYRARSGRSEEARALLREVAPSPSQLYNTACAFALLGEADLALDCLQRDLEQGLQSPAARERQKAWARDDPDLASLRGDPRFQRIVAPAQPPARPR